MLILFSKQMLKEPISIGEAVVQAPGVMKSMGLDRLPMERILIGSLFQRPLAKLLME